MDMPGGAGRPADLITRPSIREVAAASIYVGQPERSMSGPAPNCLRQL